MQFWSPLSACSWNIACSFANIMEHTAASGVDEKTYDRLYSYVRQHLEHKRRTPVRSEMEQHRTHNNLFTGGKGGQDQGSGTRNKKGRGKEKKDKSKITKGFCFAFHRLGQCKDRATCHIPTSPCQPRDTTRAVPVDRAPAIAGAIPAAPTLLLAGPIAPCHPFFGEGKGKPCRF